MVMSETHSEETFAVCDSTDQPFKLITLPPETRTQSAGDILQGL